MFIAGVKPFACKEPNCTRRFTIRPDLNDHIRKCHTGERPYHCQICGKRFLTGSVFYQHRLIHRGERRYGCEDCGKRFYRADALKNHQRIHTGEKPYACTQCPKKFRQRGDRDKHVRARHSASVLLAVPDAADGDSALLPQQQQTGSSGSTGNAPKSTAGVGGGRSNAAKVAAANRAAQLAAGLSGSNAAIAMGLPVGGRSVAANRGRIRSKKDLLMQPRPPLSQLPNIGNIPAGYTGGVAGRGRMSMNAAASAAAASAALRIAGSAAGGEDVVYVGNMAFPTSMFQPVVSDNDGNIHMF